MSVVIENTIYVAKSLNHLAQLLAIADMAKSDENWEILKPDMIRSISQYVKSV